VGDFGFEYANFYRNNLGVPVNGSAMFSEGAVGAAQGAGTAFSDAGRAAWSLLSSPVQGSEQIVNGLMSLSKHPGDAMMDSVEASQTKQAMAYIYNLQGNYAASAAITTQSDVEFALSMIPANRASTLAELSSLGRQIDDLSLSGLASGETKAVGNRGAAANDDFFAANPVDEAAGLEGKGKALSEGSTAEQPALPSYYREDSSGGAMLAKTAGLPEGYRRVFNLRTGNVEVVSPEGVFYFDTPDGGLKPKAGGNLAQLVKAEGEIAGPKEIQAGAGGTWNVLDEVANPNVVKQSTPTACGAACGEMLLKDRGVLTSQVDLGTELTSMNSLARKLNTVDSGWVGNAVDVSSFNALNKTGSWSAMM